MKHGTIVLIANDRKGKWYERLVKWFITKVTDSPFIHIEVRMYGFWYESRWPEGAIKHNHNLNHHVLLEPVNDLTDTQVDKMKDWCENMVKNKRPYNLAKLIGLLIMYPLKKFFNWLGWVPFSANRFWGTVCSVFVDEAFKAGGVDIFENMSEELTSPGDFTGSGFFKPA
jgi:hypothetical protein